MALTRGSKPWWVVHVASGVVAVALITFGVAQCSAKKSEREEKEAKKTELVDVKDKADELDAQVQDMHHQIDGLKTDNEEMFDTIYMQRDSIATLNDSLLIVNEELTDCRNSKRKPTKPAPVKPAPVKPAKVKPAPVAPVKSDTIIIVQQAPVNRGCAGETNISLNNSQNNGAIVVGNGNNVVVNTPAVQAAVDTLNNVTVKRTIYIRCTVEREY